MMTPVVVELKRGSAHNPLANAGRPRSQRAMVMASLIASPRASNEGARNGRGAQVRS